MDGHGELRVGTALTYAENMYSLCFVAQVKQQYGKWCKENEDTDEIRMKKVFVKVLGLAPDPQDDEKLEMDEYIGEEPVVDGEEEEEQEGAEEAVEEEWNGITGWLVVKPYSWIASKCKKSGKKEEAEGEEAKEEGSAAGEEAEAGDKGEGEEQEEEEDAEAEAEEEEAEDNDLQKLE